MHEFVQYNLMGVTELDMQNCRAEFQKLFRTTVIEIQKSIEIDMLRRQVFENME
jgi:hypothetical protein